MFSFLSESKAVVKGVELLIKAWPRSMQVQEISRLIELNDEVGKMLNATIPTFSPNPYAPNFFPLEGTE